MEILTQSFFGQYFLPLQVRFFTGVFTVCQKCLKNSSKCGMCQDRYKQDHKNDRYLLTQCILCQLAPFPISITRIFKKVLKQIQAFFSQYIRYNCNRLIVIKGGQF